MSNKITLIRSIYIYLFSLVGLILVIIAGVRFIDMGLKAWVFTKAEEDMYSRPMAPELYLNVPKENARAVLESGEECGFTEQEKDQVRAWLLEYENWQNQSAKFDYVVANRHRSAANSTAMLIVGLPLYLYHWRLASKKKEEDEELNSSKV